VHKKRPLACQRPKSREETPKEGGSNAVSVTARGILGTASPKLQGVKSQIADPSVGLFFGVTNEQLIHRAKEFPHAIRVTIAGSPAQAVR